MRKVYIYKIFERFWHWSQALFIFILIITGFEIHSTFNLFGFEAAVKIHNATAWAFLILIIVAIIWHFSSGEWRQYIPTTKFIKAQVEYYILGIFKGAPHPTKKLVYNKFNPLQRIIYLGLKILVIPVQVISGFLYLYFNYPIKGFELASLQYVAYFHTFGAFLLLSFIIAHIYLTTTGHKPLSSIKAMISGWEEMDNETIKERLASDIEGALIRTKTQYKSHDGKDELLSNALLIAQKSVGANFNEENKFRDAIAASRVGYFAVSPEGLFTEVNEAWIKLYKYDSPKEIIGKHYRLGRTEDDFRELEKSIEKVLAGNTVNHGEVKRICKDGSYGYHTITITPMVKKGKITGVEGFIIDTTDKRMAEKELLKKKLRIETELTNN